MRTRSLVARVAATASSILLAAALLIYVAPATGQEAHPVEGGAPYSAGVTTPAGATLAVIGGIAGEGGDVLEAAERALEEVGQRLQDVGLSKNSVVRVRAALAPVEDQAAAYAAWTEAWTSFFDGGHLPARTTLGASALPGDALIVLDVVATYSAGAPVPAAVDGARSTLSPNLRLAGPSDNPTAIVSTRPGLFFSSGALPSGDDIGDSESMERHMRSAMNGLTSSLGAHGLRWTDVFYVRVLPTPQPDREDVNFDAWDPVYETLGEMTTGRAPAHTLWASPGFGARGRYVEIEIWAVPQAPLPVFSVINPASENPLLRMTGRETSFLSSGAWIGPNARLIWLAGVIAPDGTAPEDEGFGALARMNQRLEDMGATMADVAELRVYRVEGDGSADLGAAFQEAYNTYFNNPDRNPHKPVRTNYLVEDLPGDRHVEVEAVVVLPPQTF